MKWVAVYDREDGWRIVKLVPWEKEEPSKRRTRMIQSNWIYPKPELVSCFVKTHKLVEADTEVEAWQLVSTFPSP